jgi:hypothetical protein
VSRFCGGGRDGLDTLSGNQKPAPHAKLWPRTRRARVREAGLATAGGETRKAFLFYIAMLLGFITNVQFKRKRFLDIGHFLAVFTLPIGLPGGGGCHEICILYPHLFEKCFI